jgi:hypothetical protein
MERSMIHKRKIDRSSNVNLRKRTKLKDVVVAAKELKCNWAGHVARYPDGRIPKIVENWTPVGGKRSRGRPKTRWQDEIKEKGRFMWKRKAQHRQI